MLWTHRNCVPKSPGGWVPIGLLEVYANPQKSAKIVRALGLSIPRAPSELGQSRVWAVFAGGVGVPRVVLGVLSIRSQMSRERTRFRERRRGGASMRYQLKYIVIECVVAFWSTLRCNRLFSTVRTCCSSDQNTTWESIWTRTILVPIFDRCLWDGDYKQRRRRRTAL